MRSSDSSTSALQPRTVPVPPWLSSDCRCRCPVPNLSYLVTISRQDGKIRWHSGLLADQLVDTAPRKYEDAGQGRGIVPLQNVPKQDGAFAIVSSCPAPLPISLFIFRHGCLQMTSCLRLDRSIRATRRRATRMRSPPTTPPPQRKTKDPSRTSSTSSPLPVLGRECCVRRSVTTPGSTSTRSTAICSSVSRRRARSSIRRSSLGVGSHRPASSQ